MEEFPDFDVSNVFLYVADAVRSDFLPPEIEKRGIRLETIAASIHTPTSFSTLVTGLHPSQHGIHQFGDSLDSKTPSLFTLEGTNTAFSNTINEKFNENPDSESILHRTLCTDETHPDHLGEIEPPFVFVERGPGGHAPYGDFTGNGWEYYRDRKAAPVSTYREEYGVSVQDDIEHFLNQLARLEERDLLDDTLIIYTSDHGELLGEGGSLGHNSPIRPELAYVPTVIIHPALDPRRIGEGVLRHIDFYPTICRLLDEEATKTPGIDFLNNPLKPRGTCFYSKSLPTGVPGLTTELAFGSLWDAEGGYVFPSCSVKDRFVTLVGKLLKSAKREFMRAHLREVAEFYLNGTRTYGNPGFTERAALDEVDYIASLESVSAVSKREVNEEQLRNLGYLS
jgi:hypothetical protein